MLSARHPMNHAKMREFKRFFIEGFVPYLGGIEEDWKALLVEKHDGLGCREAGRPRNNIYSKDRAIILLLPRGPKLGFSLEPEEIKSIFNGPKARGSILTWYNLEWLLLIFFLIYLHGQTNLNVSQLSLGEKNARLDAFKKID